MMTAEGRTVLGSAWKGVVQDAPWYRFSCRPDTGVALIANAATVRRWNAVLLLLKRSAVIGGSGGLAPQEKSLSHNFSGQNYDQYCQNFNSKAPKL